MFIYVYIFVYFFNSVYNVKQTWFFQSLLKYKRHYSYIIRIEYVTLFLSQTALA